MELKRLYQYLKVSLSYSRHILLKGSLNKCKWHPYKWSRNLRIIYGFRDYSDYSSNEIMDFPRKDDVP
jgi:hypothetical protein